MSSRFRAPQQRLSGRSRSGRRAIPAAVLRLGLILLAFAIAPLGLLGNPAALYAAGSLSVRVYADAGRDGVDTGGAEAGVPSVSVSVYSVDDLLVGLNTTNASGVVSFPTLPDGEYRVEVAAPSGYAVSVPGAANTNPGLLTRVQIAGAGATVSVGLRPLTAGVDAEAPANTRSVVSRVWDDLDSDGVQDADEPGLPGLTLELLGSGGAVLQAATAGPDGRYRFDSAPAGVALSVRVQTPPAGYTLTRQDVTSFDVRDSDAFRATYPPAVADIPVTGRGANLDSVDIGFTRASVAGFIWRDSNANGRYDPIAEARLNGITVELVNVDTNAVVSTTTRPELGDGGLDGVYKFSALAEGTYRVRIPASQFAPGASLEGAATPVNDQDRGFVGAAATGIPGPGQSVQTADIVLSYANVAAGSNRDAAAHFGFFKGSVGDFVWNDLDRDGLQAGELSLGVNGVLVFIDDGRGGGTPNDGVRNGGELSILTSGDVNTGLAGAYRFDDLPLGKPYRVVLDSSNFVEGGPLEGIGSSTAITGTTLAGDRYYYIDTPLLDAATPTDPGIDFGLTRSDLGNRVFVDRNGNGVFDIGEAPIPGVTVRFFRAGATTPVFTTTTGVDGSYTIGNRPAVPYYATFDLKDAVGFAGYVASPQRAGVAVEPFEDQFPDYSDLILPAVDSTTWKTPVFTPVIGLANNGVDAGFFKPVTLTGRAFFDTDGDSLDEAAPEPGMRGVTVELLRQEGASFNLAASASTALDSTGAYTFTNVAPGSYEIKVTNPAATNFDFVAKDAGSDALDSDVGAVTGRTDLLNVFSGTDIGDIDAGFTGRGQLGGRIFLDDDGSDTQTAGDSNLDGATATLTVTANTANLVATYNPVNTLGSPTASADPTPNYAFAGLPGGAGVSYSLSFAPPTASPAYVASAANQGADDAVDSDGPTITVPSPAIPVSLDYDQGFYQPVQITARVFEETATVDNRWDAGEAGLAGALVALEPAAGGAAVATQSTGADGLVTFNVKPGSYRLNVDEADADLAGYIRSNPSADPIALGALGSGDSSLTQASPTGTTNVFGFFEPGTVTGKVFFDGKTAAPDNLADGEPPMKGVTVRLLDGGLALTGTTTIDASGVYTFTNRQPGDYTVEFVNPDATTFAFSTTVAGDNSVASLSAGNGRTAELTLAPGATETRSAAVTGLETVQGTTFVDGLADGRQATASDAALAGVTVSLSAPINLPNLATTITRSATTDASGNYSFAALPGSSDTATARFSLSFAPPAATPAWTATTANVGDDLGDSDSDSELANQAFDGVAPLTPLDRDRGYYQPVRITARVIDDTVAVNNDWDASEPGLAGVTVALETSPGGVLVASQDSNASGLVTFDVAPGTYRLNVDEAEATLVAGGYARTSPADDPIVIGLLASGGSSLTETSPTGTTNIFGFFKPGTITGSVFFDGKTAAPDNLRAGEPPMKGVTVRLLDNSLAEVTSALVDASGVYTFTNRAPGTYTVQFDNPDAATFVFSTTAAGDNSVAALNANNGRTASFSLASGQTVTRRAAVTGLETVQGTTFVDGLADGLQGGTGDGPLGGVTVSLTATIDLPNLATTITRSAPSDAAGAYSFAALPGSGATATAKFSLGFTAPAATPAWNRTTADVGGDDTVDSDGELIDQAFDGAAPLTPLDRDQGFYQNVTITARVIDESVNANNQWDASEAGIAGVKVDLETVPGGVVEATQDSDAAGLVTFSVRPGTYRLNVDQADTALTTPGFTRTAPAADPIVLSTLTSGQAARTGASAPSTVNIFGFFQGATIAGSAWYDLDGDGVLDAGEPAMQGVTVNLVGNNGGPVGRLTSAAGAYSFTGVEPTGATLANTSYQLCFPLPAGFAHTAKGAQQAADNNSDAATGGATPGCSDPFTVASNGSITYIDAGYVGTLSVGNLIWDDLNANGIQDAGEPGLEGATVTLLLNTAGGPINAPNAELTLTTTSFATTGLASNYQFTRLPAVGGYVVSVTPPFGYKATQPDLGGNDALDSDRAGVNQGALSASTADLDFGFYKTTSLGDLVWLDLNGNGVYDAATEQGAGGVTVQLLKNGVPAGQTTSSATAPVGSYSFVDLDPGSYSLDFGLPAGYVFANDGAGSTSADNDNDARLDGTTAAVTLASGQANPNLDAGIVGTASLGGLAWIDEDGNNTRDAGDARRVAGVRVTLTLTPTLTGVPTTYTTTTAADGSYSFANLPGGQGVVRFASGLVNIPVKADVGGNDLLDSDGPAAAVTVAPGAALSGVDQGYRERGRVVWLPVVFGEPLTPDLTVSLKVGPESPIAGRPASVEVVVTNRGTGAASNFWVDFYINPSRVPQVNDRWNELCTLQPCFGIAWFYAGTLQPGQSVTLNGVPESATNPNGFKVEASSWAGFFANQTSTLYVIVDSWNRSSTGDVGNPEGALHELKEDNNRATQSITVIDGQLPPEFRPRLQSEMFMRREP